MSGETRIGPSGLDLRWIDHRIRPQDDLYRHVNGRWLDEAEIPDDRAQHGVLSALRDEVEADVRVIVEQCRPGGPRTGRDDDARRVGDLYASFLDVDAIEADGITPLRPILERIAAAPDRPSLAGVLGTVQREGLAGVFGVTVAPDAHDSGRALPHVSQAGLGLPDESYYREDSHLEIREQYREHLADIAALAGLPDARGLATAVLALERELAEASSDPVTSRDAEATHNVMTWSELTRHADGFDWEPWLAAFGAGRTAVREIVIAQPDFVAEFGRLWRERPLDQWRAWLTLHTVSSCAPYLGERLVEADFAFFGRTLSGSPAPPERWRRGVALVESVLGDAVGRLYVRRHFPAAARDRARALVDHLVEAYRRSVSDLDWMDAATRRRALHKLERLNVKIGYPDRWKDYAGLDLRSDDLLGNVRRAGIWRTDHELAKLGRPVDRDEWLTTPQTVNAFYNPRLNEVVFPAAVLRPPLFDPGADPAANYGGIGTTIGHEIGHALDDQGSKYDGDGNLVDWWEPDDRTRFTRRTDALVAQYEALSPSGQPDHTVNGRLTLGENVGDLAGVAIAVKAYRLAVTATEAARILENLTGEQRLFFAYARTWCAVTRPAEQLRRLTIDPHAPPELRCNAVVTNLDAFHDAFHVAGGDALYTEPADRVRLW